MWIYPGYFADDAIVQQLFDWLDGGKFDLVIPISHSTLPASVLLSGLVHLFPGAGAGHFDQDAQAWCRVYGQDVQGQVGSIHQGTAQAFREGANRKPASSRKESREVYLVAKGFKG
jgi:hypothetical protein